MLRKAGSTDTEKMVDAMKGLAFDSAFGEGPVVYRALDHQAGWAAPGAGLAEAASSV